MVQYLTPTRPGLFGRIPPALLLCALLGATASGCASRRSFPVQRRIHGTVQPGQFVPPHAYEWYLRAELWLAKDQPHEAVEAFSMALAAPELDPYVLSRMALAQALADDMQGARQTLAQAEQLSPCQPQLWVVRARIAQLRSDSQQALMHLQQALDCVPHHAEAREMLLRELEEQGAEQRVVEIARTPAPRASRHGADSATAGRALSLLERKLLLERAVSDGDVETVRRLLPAGVLARGLPHALRARAHAVLGEDERAARQWLDASPLHEHELVAASRALARAGFWPEALAAAQTALESRDNPADRRVLTALRARAMWAMERPREALQALPVEARGVLADWLASAGMPALAHELAQGAATEGASAATQAQ